MTLDVGRSVSLVDIDQEMREAYLDYAMSVIVARALPDARDGLKPVHRRILYAMYREGLLSDRPFSKCAGIVGEVLKRYHPHGDAAVYDSLARLTQEWNMRYPLVQGQGNFGSIDGDSPAAYRYTEARLATIAEELLADIEQDTVDFEDNFDGTTREPLVLPGRLPNLLLNGASGIAVGMATNIPPHNLVEICDGLTHLIDHYDQIDEVSPADLMKHIRGPDFPTGGIIVGGEGIAQAYGTGKGKLTVRAKAHIEDMPGKRHRIVVTELPYQVNKSSLIERIAELARAKRIDAISDLRDESDRRGMSIIIELKRGSQPQTVLLQLFKYTQLQTTFGVNMLALVDGEPRILTLRQALLQYVEHRKEVVRRRSAFELERARERAHILEGYLIALADIDAVIETIRRSRTAETARKNLERRFKLTKIQATAILEMPLRRLATLERKKIRDEHRDLLRRIGELEGILAAPKKILTLIRQDLAGIKKAYADERRTLLIRAEEEISEEDLVPEENVLVVVTHRGYIKRVTTAAYRRQLRGGVGVRGMTMQREEDAVQHLMAANTLDRILFFTNRGRVFQERVYQIPEAGRQGRGLPLSNILALQPQERVTAACAVPSEEKGAYLVMATRLGKVKRTALREFSTVRVAGLMAITLDEWDELGWVRLTGGKDEIVLVSQEGQAIRFPEAEIRPVGRQAGGVMGIKLGIGDRVAAMDVVEPKGYLLVVTEQGFGKKTRLGSAREKNTSKIYPRQRRYGLGVRTLSRSAMKATGKIVTARVVQDKDEVTLVSADGMVIRTSVAEISEMSRDTKGVLVMNLRAGDTVASLARVGSERT